MACKVVLLVMTFLACSSLTGKTSVEAGPIWTTTHAMMVMSKNLVWTTIDMMKILVRHVIEFAVELFQTMKKDMEFTRKTNAKIAAGTLNGVEKMQQRKNSRREKMVGFVQWLLDMITPNTDLPKQAPAPTPATDAKPK